MRVAVVAEWYPSPADPVLGVWAHRQALAARDAGAEVRVLALRRPVPPISTLRALAGRPPSAAPLRAWRRDVRSELEPVVLDGLEVTPVPFLAPPRPWSYGAWWRWMAGPLARALDRLRARWPFEVLHAHNVLPTGRAAQRWHGRLSAPRPALVVSTHGPDVIHVAGRSDAARAATVTTLGAADAVLANSRWAERRCRELAGGAPVRTRLVHLGTDVPAPAALPARHGRRTLVTLAHLHGRKRHAVVLHALAALPPAERPDYVVIGGGRGRVPLERLAAELGLSSRVRFLGQLEHARALEELWRCHVCVMPSVEEPFGVAYVEAMAGGLVAIGTRGEGGPEDIAAAGDGMLLVAPDDHVALAGVLRELLGAPERVSALGDAARATVGRAFTWPRCGDATVAAYRAALARP